MKKLATALAALAFIGGSLVSAAPAQAATGNVYVVINDRVCGGLPGTGLKVRGIVGNIDRTSWRITAYDRGDNIVYPSVQLGVRNTGTFTVECYKKPAWYLPWVHVGMAHVAQSFTPTHHGQTVWIG